MTDKPNFKRADDLATHILLTQPPFETFMIDVTKLHYDYDIIFDSMQNYCRLTGKTWEHMGFDAVKNGHTVKIDTDKYLVLYNEEHIPARINWTAGHEVGHIYFRHKNDNKIAEVETSCFAAQLIAPESPIRKLAHEFGSLDFAWIYNHFFISLQASLKRVNTLNSKYYIENKSSALLLNQFHKPLNNLVKFFREDHASFILGILEAYRLLEEYECLYGSAYTTCPYFSPQKKIAL